MLIITTLFFPKKILIASIAITDVIPPHKLNKIESKRPVRNADKRHRTTTTVKTSAILKRFGFVIINSETELASPIFAAGQNGNDGKSSSIENNARDNAASKAEVTIFFIFIP